MRRRFLALWVLCSGTAWAETSTSTARVPKAPMELTDRALWEVGVVGAGSYLPDYPAADQSRAKWIVAPYAIYRGSIMRADRDGARASFVRTRMLEGELSVAASFASDSDDNTAREGMPDLDYLLELGPRLSVTLSRLGGEGLVRFFMPVRAAFSTDFSNFHHQGWTMTPSINIRHQLVGRSDSFIFSQLTGNFADRRMNAYFYDVQPEFAHPDRPAYQARAGYQGTDLFAGVVVPLSKYLRMFTGAQFLLHTGSANSASPLYKRNENYSAAAGLIWTFYRSSKPAVVLD